MQVFNSYNLYEVESTIVYKDNSKKPIRMFVTAVNEEVAKLYAKEYIEQINIHNLIKNIGYQTVIRKTCFIKKEVIK
jgi:hypothetical protein